MTTNNTDYLSVSMNQKFRHNLALVKVSVETAVFSEARVLSQMPVVVDRINFLATAEPMACFFKASRRETLTSFKGLT